MNPANPTKHYRLAIIGLGRMASTIDPEVEGYPAITLPYSIAASAQAIPELTIVAGCDILPAKNKAFTEKWGVRDTYTDYREMLSATKPDMVAICTPGPLHAEMTIAAAEAGAAMIYCEKAMACSMKEADAAKAAVESRHIAFNTGVLRRFDPRYHLARKLILDGKIGRPLQAVHYAGSSLLHGHIHSVDTILYLLGDPRAESVSGEFRPRSLQIENNRYGKDPAAVYHIEFADGVEARTIPAGNWDFEVFGSEGVLRGMNNGVDWSLRTRQPLGEKHRTFLPVDYPSVEARSATVICLEDLIDAHEKNRPTLGSVATAHHGTEILFAAAESHRQGGKRIALPLENRELYVYHF